jgi:hypothetical protein
MPGPVVVEITAASPEAQQITAMVEACGRAVGHTHCVLARQAPEPPYEAVAIVTWLGDSRVRVETALRSGEHSDWRSRELVFQASDQELERWRAVGFVVGTLASAAAGDESAEPAPAPPTPPPRPEARRPEPPPLPVEPTRRSASERLAWLGLGWYAGDGLDAELERNGAWGRVGIRPGTTPLVAVASLGYGTSSRPSSALGTSFLDGGLGLGVALVDQRVVAFDLELEFGAERFSAQANQAFVGNSSSARWVGVLRLRPEVSLYWSEMVGTAAFGELSLRGGKTEVTVEGQDAGETSRLGYRFGLGLCLRAPR